MRIFGVILCFLWFFEFVFIYIKGKVYKKVKEEIKGCNLGGI